VDVLFLTEKHQEHFSDSKSLRKDWGDDGAKKITLRLQQLAAATCLEDMRSLPGRCHELTGDRAGSLAVDLHKGFRLVFTPAAEPPPSRDDGGLDWTAVDSITVIEIVDYH
jgi:proteic killer suppression protein